MVEYVRNYVDIIVERLAEYMEIDEAIIFGSFAYGEPNDKSDIDICFIISNEKTTKRFLLKQLRKLISPSMKHPLDIVIYDKDEFYSRACIATTLEHKIAKDGLSVYGEKRIVQ